MFQNLIDLKQKQKLAIEEGSDESLLTPLEKDLKRVQNEIKATTVFCNEAKASWLKLQQELIVKTEAQSDINEQLSKDTRRFLIMQEKSKKLDMEVEVKKIL